MYHGDGWTPEEVAQKGCGIPAFGGIYNLLGKFPAT